VAGHRRTRPRRPHREEQPQQSFSSVRGHRDGGRPVCRRRRAVEARRDHFRVPGLERKSGQAGWFPWPLPCLGCRAQLVELQFQLQLRVVDGSYRSCLLPQVLLVRLRQCHAPGNTRQGNPYKIGTNGNPSGIDERT